MRYDKGYYGSGKGEGVFFMIRAIAFDVDNTLVDFLGMKEDTARAAAKAMVREGLNASEREVYAQIFKVYDEYGIEHQKTFAEVLKKYKLKENEFERIQQAGIVAYLKCKFECMRTYPGVKETLAKLKRKYKLAVVTDAPRNKAWQRLILCDLQGYFDEVVTFHDTKKHKPDEMPFKLLLKKLRIKPSQVLFVGDNPDRDIKGAKKLGMKTALARYGQVLGKDSKEKADFELKTFKEILKIA